MNVPLLLLLPLALLLAAWLTWTAVRRPNRQRLLWRLLASWAAVAALVLILHPPHLTRSYSATEAILLTEGYAPDSLRAILRKMPSEPQVFSYGVKGSSAESITDLTAFRQAHPRVNTVHVLGNGLTPEEITLLDSVNLVPHLSPLQTGLLAASWSKEVALGEDIQVQGTFWAPEKATWLYLQAAGRNRDSVQVKKGKQRTFSFRFRPKTAGKFVYALQWKNEQDSLVQEQLPFSVLPPRTLNVLVLSSAPSFEVKFLKNALARQGHGVAVRSEVSKDLYQTEQINLPALNINRVTPAMLQKFDVVVQDEATLQSLSASERQALQQAVRQQGLGILTSFLGNSAKAVSFFAEAGFKKISQKQAINAKVNWQDGAATLEVSPFVFTAQANAQPLVWEQTPAQALVLQYRKGMGQVGLSLVPETFPMALSGDSVAYQQYWATLLTALAKPQEPKASITFASLVPPRAKQPLELTASILSGFTLTKEGTDSSFAPAYTPALILPASTGQISQLEQGWYTVRSAADSIGNIFIHPAYAWKTQALRQQQQALLQSAKVNAPAETDDFTQQEPMALWPFYLLFLFAAGFLWLEEKL